MTAAAQVAPAIALYLPQFHPIPENDEWWGKGFTEWRNVAKSRPKFPGHVQPRLPADMGFYDLRLDETRIQQAELAKAYGIHGFCYYHYWFEGRRLLHRPMDGMLKNQNETFPFCVCWANENWTRRWDGLDREVLIAQSYSDADDLAHIRFLAPILADPRYIRVDGRPLLIIYRTELLPNPRRTAEIWREEAERLGVGPLYLARFDSVEAFDPERLGFDASIEFAPTWRSLPHNYFGDSWLERVARGKMGARMARGRHNVYRYADLVEHMMDIEESAYTRFRCACPSWDNSPRRAERATMFLDPKPELFEKWIRYLVQSRQQVNGEAAPIFINAWNEWAEGAHLEPCDRFGNEFLEAVRRAVTE